MYWNDRDKAISWRLGLDLPVVVRTLAASVGATCCGEHRANKSTCIDGPRLGMPARRGRPLKVTIYGWRRIGGYSYRASNVTSTYGSSHLLEDAA